MIQEAGQGFMQPSLFVCFCGGELRNVGDTFIALEAGRCSGALGGVDQQQDFFMMEK